MTLRSDVLSPASYDDLVLCGEIVAGNTAAFALLAGKYTKRIFALGFSFFKNPDDTDDFVQDVLVKVYLAIASFRGESRFSTWLLRIAYNTAINSIKRKREYTSLAEDFDVAADSSENPEEQLLRECSRQAIAEALALLPEKYRVCVDMYFYYGMAYADISEVTGQPVNTIKSHVFRAKKILRERLGKQFIEGKNI